MNPLDISQTAVSLTLKLVRLPVDLILKRLPGGAEPNRPKQPSPAQPSPLRSRPTPSHDDIAARAYELYERGAPGTPDDHWRTAERELSTASH
jgi:hypothetical protein